MPTADPPATAWTHTHLAHLPPTLPAPPFITAADLPRILPSHDIWDMWPLALPNGAIARINHAILWFALAAPRAADPIARHGLARIRLLRQSGATWHDLGPALPDGLHPGSREWSGSAILGPNHQVRLFFTVAGHQAEPAPSPAQRLFHLTGTLTQASLAITWHGPARQLIAADNHHYLEANEPTGLPGQIRAFRDPAYFHDPADGHDHILFAGSHPAAPGLANGVIGLARADAHGWHLLPPIVTATGVNFELERPHAILHNGKYYLFWCTQRHTFTPPNAGPTGLYGMVAESLRGPYRPLNRSGLVLANPPAEPLQAYAWWVTGEGAVTSFTDFWGLAGRNPDADPALKRSQFGGVPAPFVRLALHEDTATLLPGASAEFPE